MNQDAYTKVSSYEGRIGDVKRVVLLFSGGLDTSVMLKWIQDTYKAEVIALTLDLGQQGDDLEAIKKKTFKLGAQKAYVIDAKDEFADDYLSPLIKANGSYQGDYYISTVSRYLMAKGKKRIYVPSSAFTRLMPIFGPTNGLSCRVHQQGRQPNGQDIHPNGQERWCIAQNTYKDGMRCKGCFYIGIDRNGDFWNFENLARLRSDDIRWLNADVWMKDPDYDPTGKNLFFNAEGIPL